MWQYIGRRLLMLIPVLIGVSIVTFLMVHIAPGDPVDLLLPETGTAEDAAILRAKLGLDKPLHIQYFIYLKNAVQLDFGRSLRTGRSVSEELFLRWPSTIELTIYSLFIAVIVGIPIGILSAVKRGSFLDHSSMIFALLWVCMPSFFIALLLQLVFSMNLKWFPVFGQEAPLWTLEGLRALTLPAISLGLQSSAILARLTRSSLLEILKLDYIRTARAKGLPEKTVIFRHATKNALIPVTTMLGLQFGGLLGGAFITETIFSLPGVGRYSVNAIFTRDFPIIQGVALMMALVFALSNLLVDIMYAYLDPRIRYD